MQFFKFTKAGAAIGAQTAAGTSDVITNLRDVRSLAAQLHVTAAATDAGDILAVWLQTSYDGGAKWHDVGRFADVLGNGGAVERIMRLTCDAVTTAEEAQQDAAVAAGTVRNGPIGDRLRLKWTVTDDASFTFAVVGVAHTG